MASMLPTRCLYKNVAKVTRNGSRSQKVRWGVASGPTSTTTRNILFAKPPYPDKWNRWHTTTANRGDGDDNNVDQPKTKIVYQSPMGHLITRLKVVSISSCLMSIVGLPILIALKNGDFPTAKQLGMGGVAFVGATGSTVALHFVFGPYVLELEQLPVRQCHHPKGRQETKTEEEEMNAPSHVSNTAATPTIATAATPIVPTDSIGSISNCGSGIQPTLLRATTRSVFGWKNELVFDPSTDITPYSGNRPFANFVAKNMTLYVHPHLLDDDLRHLLFSSSSSSSKDSASRSEAGPNRREDSKKQTDDDFL